MYVDKEIVEEEDLAEKVTREMKKICYKRVVSISRPSENIIVFV